MKTGGRILLKKMDEATLQTQCVRYMTLQYPQYSKVFFHVANGGSRNKMEAYNLKLQGVKSGVADLLLLVPNKTFHGLCIELKHGKNRQTDHQKTFEQQVTAQGYKYTVCYTFDEFYTTINNYLANK